MVITLEEYNGRAREISSATTITVDRSARLWFVNMTAGSQQVRMPDARTLKKGGAHFVVAMRSGSSAVTLADNGGNAITTSDGTSSLAALTRAMMLLVDNSTANGTWVAKKDAITTATNPSPSEFLYEHGGTNTTSGAGPRRVRTYNHQLDTWSTGTDSSFDCKEGGGFRIGTVGGVWHGNNASPRNKVQHYDPGTWTTKADSPRNHESFATASVGGASSTKGYAFGGTQTTNVGVDTDEYTLAGDTWALRAQVPIELRSVGYGVSYGSYAYVLWGDGPDISPLGLAYRYDPTANTWAAMTSSPSLFLEDHACGAFDGFILKVGGRSPSSSQVHVYDISLNAWVARALYPLQGSPVAAHGAAIATPESVPIMCGGQRGATANSTRVDRYFRLTDVWVQKTAITQAPGFLCNQAIAGTP